MNNGDVSEISSVEATEHALKTLKSNLQHFKEHEINFYATYKRDKHSGLVTTYKGRKRRLVGYADRIIYKSKKEGAIKTDIYQSMYISGNDHLPVICVFNA